MLQLASRPENGSAKFRDFRNPPSRRIANEGRAECYHRDHLTLGNESRKFIRAKELGPGAGLKTALHNEYKP
jgi:hypothetical protein